MKKFKIYLDNCCFNRPYDNQESLKIKLESDAKLYIQKKIKEGLLELVWSYMLDLENSDNPFDDRKQSIEKWKKISFEDVEQNEEIIKVAEDLFIKGIKNKDAIHISSAIYAGADYFITTDKGILNKSNVIDKIQIINPIELINILEEE